MSIHVQWDNTEETILRYTFHGNWSWDEFLTYLITGREMMQRVHHPVHIICDLTHSGFIPKHSIKPFKNIVDTRPANTALVFLVSNHYLVSAIYFAIQRIYPQLCEQYRLVPDEAKIQAQIERWEAEQDPAMTS